MSTHNIYLDLLSTSHQGVARTKARMVSIRMGWVRKLLPGVLLHGCLNES